MDWQFFLDDVEIEEPKGFSDIVFSVLRDEIWHGVMFEASTSLLHFYGEAFDYLKEKKEIYGVEANVIFTANAKCDGETEYEEAISGKLNFAKYQESCGTDCLISLPVVQDDCTMILKNRFDQKVSVDSNIAFDKQTVLQDYDGLGITMELGIQDIPISADAEVGPDGDGGEVNAQGNGCDLFIRPVYSVVNSNSIATGQLDNVANFYEDCAKTFLLSPQVLIEENPICIDDIWTYDVRLKGTIKMDIVFETFAPPAKEFYTVLAYWDGVGKLETDKVVIQEDLIEGSMVDGVVYSFDKTYTGTATIPQGVGVYAYIVFVYESAVTENIYNITYTFDPATYFILGNTRSCPVTDAKVYMVNETLSRVVESVTNRCLTVKSDYYGREDSEPYASTVDGCGSKRVLTSGLRIRGANDKEFFASPKDIIEGLKAIDNIGMGIEGDRLRIEPVRYFYNEKQILTLDLIPNATTQIVENLVYSLVKVGYKKWEIKAVQGIDEINSTKEFRTNISTVSRTLEATSDLIASGYIIEELRNASLANSGNKDSSYDNDIFIICVERSPYAYEGYIVEQGVAENVTELFSPTTVYNWRIRPLYNLMRWAKSIFPAYPILNNTTSKLYFSSGTGNYKASGNLPATDTCRLENKALAENSDIAYTDFNADDYLPIWKPEKITFDYPLSLKDYKLIKAEPYGYINLQCGGGDFAKGYINDIKYSVAKGTANFDIRLKWQ